MVWEYMERKVTCLSDIVDVNREDDHGWELVCLDPIYIMNDEGDKALLYYICRFKRKKTTPE